MQCTSTRGVSPRCAPGPAPSFSVLRSLMNAVISREAIRVFLRLCHLVFNGYPLLTDQQTKALALSVHVAKQRYWKANGGSLCIDYRKASKKTNGPAQCAEAFERTPKCELRTQNLECRKTG